MLDLLIFLLRQIVDDPEAIEIKQSTDETGTEIFMVTVSPEDMGKVIGKGGKIISAIRELVKVKAIKSNQRVKVTLTEPTQTDSPSPQLSTESPEEMS